MNIYFSCSITGGRQDQAVYQALVDALLSAGHEVPTAHLSNADIMSLETVVAPHEVYCRDVAWITACDAVIAEVSTPSHGVGYEIAIALGLNKPVLCCYREDRRVSKMITGNDHPALTLLPYMEPEEAVEGMRVFLGQVSLVKRESRSVTT